MTPITQRSATAQRGAASERRIGANDENREQPKSSNSNSRENTSNLTTERQTIMSDLNSKAYDAVSRAAYAVVQDVGAGIISEIEAGYIKDEDDLQDLLHSAVDSALTYTVDQWVCAWGLPDCDEGLSDGAADFDKALACKAYENLRGAVQDRFADRFSEAMAVAADKAEEGVQS